MEIIACSGRLLFFGLPTVSKTLPICIVHMFLQVHIVLLAHILLIILLIQHVVHDTARYNEEQEGTILWLKCYLKSISKLVEVCRILNVNSFRRRTVESLNFCMKKIRAALILVLYLCFMKETQILFLKESCLVLG